LITLVPFSYVNTRHITRLLDLKVEFRPMSLILTLLLVLGLQDRIEFLC